MTSSRGAPRVERLLQRAVERPRCRRRRGASATAPARRASGRGRTPTECARGTARPPARARARARRRATTKKSPSPSFEPTGMLAGEDAVGVSTMPEPSAWRKISVRRATGTRPESITSRSTWPGPTDGSWSTSPTSTSVAPGAHRRDQRARQLHVEHRRLVDDEQIAGERVVVAAPRTATRARPSFCGCPTRAGDAPSAPRGRSPREPLGGAARRRRRAARAARPAPSSHERAHEVVLPVPGPPVMTASADLVRTARSRALLPARETLEPSCKCAGAAAARRQRAR